MASGLSQTSAPSQPTAQPPGPGKDLLLPPGPTPVRLGEGRAGSQLLPARETHAHTGWAACVSVPSRNCSPKLLPPGWKGEVGVREQLSGGWRLRKRGDGRDPRSVGPGPAISVPPSFHLEPQGLCCSSPEHPPPLLQSPILLGPPQPPSFLYKHPRLPTGVPL